MTSNTVLAEPARSIANPSFEEASSEAISRPAGWITVGTPGIVELDSLHSYTGVRSVRLERKPPFTGIGQVIDVAPWRGKVITISAQFRAEGLGTEAAGLWARTDIGGRTGSFASSYAAPIPSDGQWVVRATSLYVDPRAERLLLGAATAASGSLWVDTFDLAEYLPDPTRKPAPASKAYLETALDHIKSNALRAKHVNWSRLTPVMYDIAAATQHPAGTYEAIRLALAALGDRHSHLIPAAAANERKQNDRTDDFGIVSQSVGDKAYLLVPGFSGGNARREAAFAETLGSAIHKQWESGARCFIVDLRQNGGGNMHPMIAGLSALLGDGELGYFVSDNSRTPWFLKEGKAGAGEKTHSSSGSGASLGEARKAPVAVLIGDRTSSSGEATLISFIGRPNTRTFGTPTAGQSTANTAIALSDGVLLALTVAVLADRTGRTYGDRIAPDVTVAEGSAVGTGAADPVLQQATRWLDELQACSRQ